MKTRVVDARYQLLRRRNKRWKIDVCKQGLDCNSPGEVIETIHRVLRAEMCGNFNPLYCRYKNSWRLVHAREGDLSDPFRREESWSLYIVV